MKKFKIAYWISTGIFGILLTFMGIMYFISPEIATTFDQLGFPDYLRIELGIAKIVGGVLLLIPFRGRLNEWVYAGFTFNLLSASLAHFASGDPISKILVPLVLLAILAASYITGHKLDKLL